MNNLYFFRSFPMSDRQNMMKYARGDMPSACLKPCLRTKVRLRELSNVLSHRGGRTLGLVIKNAHRMLKGSFRTAY